VVLITESKLFPLFTHFIANENAAIVTRQAGYWLLVAGFWFLVSGCWLLVSGFWLLVTGCWYPLPCNL